MNAFRITGFFVFFFFLVGKGECASFLPETEDVPKMDGLSLEEPTSVFDKADGKIIIIKGVSSKPSNEIKQFYQQSLSNLGWKSLGTEGLRYQRGTQNLSLSLKTIQEKTECVFELTESH